MSLLGTHCFCIFPDDEKPSPHSLLLKDVHDNKCKGRPSAKPLKQKYTSLEQLKLKHYESMFVELHVEIVIKYCLYLFEKSNKMGLERNEFCAMLITKVIQINDGYMCNDEEWASIFKVIERFAAMKLQIHSIEHPNIENTNVIIEDTNNCKEIILKLWLKKNKIRIVSPEMFCKTLQKDVKCLLNQTNKFQFKTKTNIQINTVDEDNDIIIEEKNENIMDEDNDIDVSGNDEIEQSATATCPVITICCCSQICIIVFLMTLLLILNQQKYCKWSKNMINLSQNSLSNIKEFHYLMNFHIM